MVRVANLVRHGGRGRGVLVVSTTVATISVGAKQVRTAANADPNCVCWLCGETARVDDPWTADHVEPGNPDSILMPAHRSCNSRRGDGRGRRGELVMRLEKR